MIYYNSDKVKNIKNISDNSLYVVTDFDRTLTLGSSKSSWEILSSSFVDKNYIVERDKLAKTYRPIEVDETIDEKTKNKKMIEWWQKHIELLIKYKLKEEVINNAIKDVNIMDKRSGLIEMLTSFHKRNIPVIIISAGIGNFIELFLKINNCYFDNIIILSNFIKFKNKVAVGLENNIIHSQNKNEVGFTKEIKEKINNRNNIILMGDILSDVKMIKQEKRDKAFKIAFIEENIKENLSLFKEKYDMVCTNNTSFYDVNKIINKLI